MEEQEEIVDLPELHLVSDDVRLEILLGRLMEVKADLRVERLVLLKVHEGKGEILVALGLPFPDNFRVNHRGSSPPAGPP